MDSDGVGNGDFQVEKRQAHGVVSLGFVGSRAVRGNMWAEMRFEDVRDGITALCG